MLKLKVEDVVGSKSQIFVQKGKRERQSASQTSLKLKLTKSENVKKKKTDKKQIGGWLAMKNIW